MTLRPDIHKNILHKILVDIYSDTTISPFLGFKGGTAAYLFYGLPRFSVDLDFDLLDESQEKHVFERVGEIIKKYGTIKDAEKKRFNLFFLLSYDQKEKNAQNVKIEINRRDFGSKYDTKSYMGISMLVMTKEDMFANKLMAMHERLGKANRDVFDVWYFLNNNWPINEEIIEKRTTLAFKKFFRKCIADLEKFDDHNILDGMGELLKDEKQKDWVRNNLKKETIFLLKSYLSIIK
ncbi:MAG: nucleotidyl transferase AbiEii/AbiGii toxin family protein [Patescibacteria group bacterium]